MGGAFAMWIFGYGSLIFRPSFPFLERRPAWISGWSRRFWQTSTDHRGVPESPGRVVTLVQDAGARCWGVAYRLAPEQVDDTLRHLDHREQGGYERHEVNAETEAGQISALIYLAGAGPKNPGYLESDSLEEIATIIRSASGPSGTNRSYIEELAAALTSAGEYDAHVHPLAELVANSQVPDDASLRAGERSERTTYEESGAS